jgi:hypothetical protein
MAISSPNLAEVARYKRNLYKAFTRATPADIREGLAWYPTAVAGCLVWSKAFELPAETIACMIAAVSPRCDWTSNLRIVFELLSGQSIVTHGALPLNVRKARAIHQAKAVTVDNYYKLAPKVRAFAKNLQGQSWHVTIDRHAAQCAMNDATFTGGVTPAAYLVFADCYREVAYTLGYRPCDFQAILWCAWKRRYSRALKSQLTRKGRNA